MESNYKLYYFDGNGRAVNMRAMLTYSKAQWEDVKISFNDWPALKTSGKYEFGQLPVLEVDGKLKSQTMAMELYLARRFNLLGSTAEDEYQILNVLCTRDDYSKHLYALLMPTEEQKAKLEENVTNLKVNVLPDLLKALERRYLENGQGNYFLGANFSLADIFIATGLTQLFESVVLKPLFADLPAVYAPNVWALVGRVKANELKEFFEKVYNSASMF